MEKQWLLPQDLGGVGVSSVPWGPQESPFPLLVCWDVPCLLGQGCVLSYIAFEV